MEASRGQDRALGNEAGEALRQKVAEAYEEFCIYGTVIEADLVVCVGRKPLEVSAALT